MNIEKYGNFKSSGSFIDKKQIILCHTSRNINDYLSSLENRFNGKYNKIPNYLITREGKTYQLLKNREYSNFFNDEKINKNSIVICLENLGWLNKEPLKDYYVNWIGDIYNGKIVDKKWRDYFFWQPYTDIQIDMTIFLCKKMIEKMNIKNDVIEHNTKINGIEKFEGVVTRSNFNVDFTDLSPAFNFEYLYNKIKNE